MFWITLMYNLVYWLDLYCFSPKARELQIRTTINQRFIETNEKEKLKEFLRTKLVECGWRDEMKTYCRGKMMFS